MKSWLTKEQILFSKHITANNLPHAILISGVTGSGKLELGTWLIHVLQCKNLSYGEIIQPCFQCKNCNLLAKKSYPDHLHVSSDKSSLGVDHIRQASLFFEKTAQIGRIKTVLIPNAETMTIAAANALLKTLEEPTENSIIILLSNERDTLLPTIISRCRLFEIRPPAGSGLLKELGSNSEGDTNPFVNLSQLPELSDVNTANEFQLFESEYLRYLSTKKNKSTFIKTVTNTSYGLRWLEKITVNLMRANEGWLNTANLNEKSLLSIKSDTLWKIYNKITTITIIKTLSQANSQFLIEKLIIDIDHMLMNE